MIGDAICVLHFIYIFFPPWRQVCDKVIFHLSFPHGFFPTLKYVADVFKLERNYSQPDGDRAANRPESVRWSFFWERSRAQRGYISPENSWSNYLTSNSRVRRLIRGDVTTLPGGPGGTNIYCWYGWSRERRWQPLNITDSLLDGWRWGCRRPGDLKHAHMATNHIAGLQYYSI